MNRFKHLNKPIFKSEISSKDSQDLRENPFNIRRQLLEESIDRTLREINAGAQAPKTAELKGLKKLMDELRAEDGLTGTKGVPVRIKNLNLHYACLFFLPVEVFTVIVYGGTGTGKSHCVTAQRPLKTIIEEADHSIYVLRETKESLEGSVYEAMKVVAEEEGWNRFLKFGYKDGYPFVLSLTTGSRIFFRGVDKIEKLLSQRPTSFIIEEADFVTPKIYEELERRLRAGDDAKKEIVFVLNPRPRALWMKERFFDKPDPTVFLLKCHYTHNKFLTQADIQRYEKHKEINYADYVRFTEGDWYVEPESEPTPIMSVELDDIDDSYYYN